MNKNIHLQKIIYLKKMCNPIIYSEISKYILRNNYVNIFYQKHIYIFFFFGNAAAIYYKLNWLIKNVQNERK